MKVFEIIWSETVREHYSAQIEAESEEEAKMIWEDSPYDNEFNGYDVEGISLEFGSIKEITNE